MKFVLKMMVALPFAIAGATSVSADTKGDVEVLHWWTSGGEAKALEVLKKDLAGKGVTWSDMPIAGGGGENAKTVLRARVTAGNPPSAAQLLGYPIKDWAGVKGALGDLNEIAKQEGWDSIVPKALQDFSKQNGNWVAAPVNIHSTNWMWFNKKALDKVGGNIPNTWDELITVLDAMKASGITPLAHGGQDWQDATLFDSIVLGLGDDFYRGALLERDPKVLGSEKMVVAFDRMTKLRSYVDKNFSGRDWNLASAMVIEGKAGAQVMGDWAKGEFLNAGKVPNVDFVCARFPGTQGALTFLADQFAMFNVSNDKKPAQLAMAKSILSPEFQIAFNTVKGSVPARTDISSEKFDACGKKGMYELAEANKSGRLFGSMAHGHAAPSAVQSALYDVVTAHFNGEYKTSKEAVEGLMNAIEGAK